MIKDIFFRFQFILSASTFLFDKICANNDVFIKSYNNSYLITNVKI